MFGVILQPAEQPDASHVNQIDRLPFFEPNLQAIISIPYKWRNQPSRKEFPKFDEKLH
jgi:hypothetical protein